MHIIIKNCFIFILIQISNTKSQIFDIEKCLLNKPHCENLPSLISDFMDSLYLWTRFINNEENFIDKIKFSQPEIPNDIIHEIYKYVENDLLKSYKRTSFYYSLDYVKYNRNNFDEYKLHCLYMVIKYENDLDVNSLMFKYPSKTRVKNTISIFDKEIILEQKIRLHQITTEKARKLLLLINNIDEKQKIKLNILELLDLLHIEENEQIENFEAFLQIMKIKCDLHISEIQQLYPYLKDIIYKQRSSLEDITKFLELKKEFTYMHAWEIIKIFIDAFSAEDTRKADSFNIDIIFYNKFKSQEIEKSNKLYILLNEYKRNYNRIKMKNDVVALLKSNENDKNKYLPLMHQMLILYETDWTITDYMELRKIFEKKDIIVKYDDFQLIYKYYFKCADFHRRQNALEELYQKVKSNSIINIFKIYRYIDDVANLYNLKNEEISFYAFYDEIKEIDYTINDMQMVTIYPFLNRYNLLKERIEAKRDLIAGFNEYIYSTCFLTSKNFQRFSKLYKIERITNFDYYKIKEYMLQIDENMISSLEIEHITKYLSKCFDYQKRNHISKILFDYAENNDQIPFIQSLYSERYIKEYKLNEIDLKNFDYFYYKIKSMDDIVLISKLYKIYPFVSSRKKYNIRNSVRTKIMYLYKNGEPKLRTIIELLEKIISEYNIDIEKINIKYFNNIFLLLDGKAINRQVIVIFNSIIKYQKYLKRKNYLNTLILYLKQEDEIYYYKTRFYMDPVISEYQLININIYSKKNFINQIIKFDENIDFLESEFIYHETLKYLESYRRSILYDALSNYIDANKEKKFFHLSNNIKNFVKLYQLNLNDITSFGKFINKVNKFEGICHELKLKNLYPFFVRYFYHLKKLNSFTGLIGFRKNIADLTFVKFKQHLNYLKKHYNLDHENSINFISILKVVKEIDGYVLESTLSLVYSYLKYHLSNMAKTDQKEMILIKKAISNIQKNYESMSHNKIKNIFKFYDIIYNPNIYRINKFM